MASSPDGPLESTRGLRPDFASGRRSFEDGRSPERLLAHYSLERELSDRLRYAPREQRLALYGTVYQELFDALRDHPQRTAHENTTRAAAQLRIIARYLQPDSAFLEIGCGDAALAFAAANRVATAYGLDVTDALIDASTRPKNFVYVRTSGIDIPLPDNTVDFAYSYQFMEHLHPDDAMDQLREIHRVLRSGARYLCITPNQLTGPHDISLYFDYQATCLHLREYQYAALRAISKQVGFREFSCLVFVKGREISFPYWVLRAAEVGMLTLSLRMRAKLARARMIRAAMGLNAVMTK